MFRQACSPSPVKITENQFLDIDGNLHQTFFEGSRTGLPMVSAAALHECAPPLALPQDQLKQNYRVRIHWAAIHQIRLQQKQCQSLQYYFPICFRQQMFGVFVHGRQRIDVVNILSLVAGKNTNTQFKFLAEWSHPGTGVDKQLSFPRHNQNKTQATGFFSNRSAGTTRQLI